MRPATVQLAPQQVPCTFLAGVELAVSAARVDFFSRAAMNILSTGSLNIQGGKLMELELELTEQEAAPVANDVQKGAGDFRISKVQLWTGRVLSGIVSAFLLVDGGMKLFKPEAVVRATLELGYPESSIVGIGLALLASTILYVVPRTSVIGAILLTGYLGGAVATHVRVGAGAFNVLFPVIFGAIVWGGLWLRNEQVRRLVLSPRSASSSPTR